MTALDSRLPVTEGGGLLRKAFPEHWSFLLGELALYSFGVLLLTGVYLTLFFEPSLEEVVYDGSYAPLQGVRMTVAYSSTLDISFDVRGGLLIRQTHHWAALVFVAAIGAHMLRVFFTGAFRRPREVNWIIGLTLFVLAIFEGFAGYSLPDDLLSGTGLRVAQGIALSLPVVGTYVALFLFGGQYPGEEITQRLYSVHILLVPGLLLALITVHLILVFYLKHTQWATRGHTNRNAVGIPMFPQFAVRSASLFLLVSGVLVAMGALAQVNPIWVYGPNVPSQVSNGSQPDWYIGFLIGGLRLMPPWETNLAGHTVSWNVFIPGLVLPGLLFTLLYAWPFLERWLTGDRGEHHLCDRPRHQPTRTGLGVAGFTFYAVLLVAGGDDILAYVFGTSVNTMRQVERVALIVAPVLAFLVTKRLCTALQDRERDLLTDGIEGGGVSQTVEGGFTSRHLPVPADRMYRILVRSGTAPLTPGTLHTAPGRPPRRVRARAALSRWFHGGQAEPPVTEGRRKEIERAAAGPSDRPTDQDT
ncbi:ubiquinol-cytochrome c reductase cytochrome b subunit [Streptomyces sp. DSM 42041]|uniref:Cytochrome bc1 complex cytochrome b subunit n=1 Tax=Streptomyces hazeniae TaxID=3075538 RepID=A0ABU2NRE2_9ACTN|nr:ubiquinol-cytochrome c reductase cytochrome b subunit [Streptomyces sp. DSM 42041]MDT0378198.1 ubiquinol-cytochrome c reductase cytochrome b subunit [Streptomyces sp. DSM 42041]